MTLIIGIKCCDGVVMGADSAATFASPGGIQTIRQTHEKLAEIDGQLIIGTSGPGGIAQRIKAKVQEKWRGAVQGTPEKAMVKLREAIWTDLKTDYEICCINSSGPLGQMTLQQFFSATLLALPIKNAAHLIEFDHVGTPELVPDDISFTSIGSGKAHADPILALFKEVFWKKARPTLKQGKFAVTWALEHACETHPGGVAKPIQLMVLEPVNNELRARSLRDEELDDHRMNIERAKEALARFEDAFEQAGPEEATEPEAPQTAAVVAITLAAEEVPNP